MIEATIELTNKFADDTTRKLEIGPFDSDAAVVHSMAIKANVNALNADVSEIEDIYISENGAKFTGVESAVITLTEETILI